MSLHGLTVHFEKAVANIRAAMPDMSKKALKEAGFPFKSVPELQTEPWNSRRHDSNCYDFALDRPGRFRIPGDRGKTSQQRGAEALSHALSGEEVNFFEFAERMREGLINDGLVELGDRPELSERGTLVALFMGDASDLEEAGRPPGGEPDAHFYVLRREDKKLVWAHKEGIREVEVLGSDPAAPFEDAPRHGDRFFGGFWLVPNRG